MFCVTAYPLRALCATVLAVVLALVSLSVSEVASAQLPRALPLPSQCDGVRLESHAQKPAADKGWVPIVLVHGITDSAKKWRRSQIGGGLPIPEAIAVVPGSAVYTFDYGSSSLNWVTDPDIGPALADGIRCLAQASGHQVIVVAHSMGGLAAQQAQGSLFAGELSAVITIGTPNQGSELAGAAPAATLAAGISSPLLAPYAALFPIIAKVCGEFGVRHPEDAACWAVSSFDTPAGRAMTPGSPELAALPAWRPGIAVHRIATELNLTGQLGPLKGAHDVGDVLVSSTSATAGGTEKSFVDDCSADVSGAISSPCYHGKQTQNPAVVAVVVNRIQKAIRGGLAWAPPVFRPSLDGVIRDLVGGIRLDFPTPGHHEISFESIAALPSGSSVEQWDAASDVEVFLLQGPDAKAGWRRATISELADLGKPDGTRFYVQHSGPFSVRRIVEAPPGSPDPGYGNVPCDPSSVRGTNTFTDARLQEKFECFGEFAAWVSLPQPGSGLNMNGVVYRYDGTSPWTAVSRVQGRLVPCTSLMPAETASRIKELGMPC